jgi:hypothetical protein
MGQSAAPAVRIVNPIDEKQMVMLGGTVHPMANAKNDRGAAPDSTPLQRVHLMLKRSASQQAALDQMMSQLHTPGHPNYHKWLTPDQFGKQFGPSDQDIATVETWLAGHGFSVTGALPGKQVIEFSGNVGQFRGAFHAQIHKYQVNGESHFANANVPQIPAALAPVVGGFVSLNNFRIKKQSKLVGKAQYDRTTHTATPMPGWTRGTGTTPGNVDFVLAPQDFTVEYDLNPLYTASTPVNGSGQTTTVNVTVNAAAAASYALTNSAANLTVSPGATTANTSTITVTPSNGFTGTVALACAFTSNAATDPATCSLSPASVDITSGALTSALTLNTTAATSAKNEVKKLIWPSTGGVALASLLFVLVPRRRRNWLAMLGLLAVLAGLAGMGCGGGGGNGGGGGSGGNTGTTAGTYTVTVTGTSGSASQMTTVTLTVN